MFTEIETSGLGPGPRNMSAYRVTPEKGARVEGIVTVGIISHEVSKPGAKHYDQKITAPAMWIEYTPALGNGHTRSLLTVNGKEYGAGFTAYVSGRIEFRPAEGNDHLAAHYQRATVGDSDYFIHASINQFDHVTDGARKVLNALAEAIAMEYVTAERWHSFQVDQAVRKVSNAKEKVEEATEKLTAAQAELATLVEGVKKMTIIESRKLTPVDGFDLRAELVPDTDTSVWDYYDETALENSTYEGAEYDKELVAAWRRQEWDYVGIIVTASRAGVDLGAASLWGTDHGMIPGVDRWSDPLRDDRIESSGLVDEAIDEARAKLAELLEGVKK